MEEIKLAAELRDGKSTKKTLTTLRSAEKIPGVVYGGAKPPILITLSERDLMAARRKGGINAILHLDLGKGKETVIVKELQRHPVSDRPVHADFKRISLTQKIEAKVPLHIKGEAPGVKLSGGIIQHELRTLHVRALPTAIPHFIEVDVSALELGQAIHVKDLKPVKDLEVLDDGERIILHVTLVKVEEVAPAADATAAAAVAADPELASTKGKKDEEGKLVAEKPKPGAPAAPAAKEAAKK